MNKKMKNKEIRVIRVPYEAIVELLWENLMKSGEQYFDLHRSDDTIKYMFIDDETKDLIYAVTKRTAEIDVEKISYESPITVETLFKSNTRSQKIYAVYEVE